MIITTRIAGLLVLATLMVAAGLGSLALWGMDRRCISDPDMALRALPDEMLCPEIDKYQLRFDRALLGLNPS